MQLCAFQALSILSKGLCLTGYVETNTDVSLVSFRASYIKPSKKLPPKVVRFPLSFELVCYPCVDAI